MNVDRLGNDSDRARVEDSAIQIVSPLKTCHQKNLFIYNSREDVHISSSCANLIVNSIQILDLEHCAILGKIQLRPNHSTEYI